MLIFDQWHHWLAHNQSHHSAISSSENCKCLHYQAFWNTTWEFFFPCLIQCPGPWGEMKARRAPIHLHSSGEWDSNRDNKCYYLYYPLICTLSAAKTLQIFLTPSRTISTCFQAVNLISDLHPRDYNKMWNNLNIESHFTENGNRHCRGKTHSRLANSLFYIILIHILPGDYLISLSLSLSFYNHCRSFQPGAGCVFNWWFPFQPCRSQECSHLNRLGINHSGFLLCAAQ